MGCSMPGFPVFHHLLEHAQTHAHWAGDAIQPSLPLSFSSPPAFYLSQHQDLFQWVSLRIMWPKYWSISPSNEYSWLISFRMDWLDLLAGQETLKSLLQNHSLKASVLPCSAFFMVQLSYPYMTTGKTIALKLWIFVSLHIMEPFPVGTLASTACSENELVPAVLLAMIAHWIPLYWEVFIL